MHMFQYSAKIGSDVSVYSRVCTAVFYASNNICIPCTYVCKIIMKSSRFVVGFFSSNDLLALLVSFLEIGTI